MKTNNIITVYVIFLFIIASLALSSYAIKPDTNQTIDLEIYTTTDIFYINGLTVTSELDKDLVYRFTSMAELKEFIIEVTLSYNKEAYDCLMESDSLKSNTN